MTKETNLIPASFSRTSFLTRILMGAAIALCAILFFIVGAETQPNWPDLWRIRPLIMTPLAGAFGGGLFYLTSNWLQEAGLNRITAAFFSLAVYLVVLWLGIVLGLEGTLWD